jgi:hypothetical protein
LLTRNSISLLLIIAIVVWGAFLWFLRIPLTWEHIKPYSLTLTVLTGGWSLFDKYLWRMWPCKKFVRMPNINGMWRAVLQSSYEDPKTGERKGPIGAYIAIQQTFTSLSIRLMTAEEHESFLVASSFDIKKDGTTYIYGVYQGVPNILDRKTVSSIHYGSFRYKVIGTPVTEIAGHYWTDRNTSGSIQLSDPRSERYDSFASAKVAREASYESERPLP